jgi:hypothetical protein
MATLNANGVPECKFPLRTKGFADLVNICRLPGAKK